MSSTKQRDDLERQIERLCTTYPNANLIQAISSGLNFKRKDLHTLLERLMRGDKLNQRDRFGIDVLRFLIEYNGGKLVVFDSTLETSRETELTADLLAILHHFFCRMYGQRSHQGKTIVPLPDGTTAKPVPAMLRSTSTTQP